MQIIIGEKVHTPVGIVCEIEWMHGDADASTSSQIILGGIPEVERFVSLLNRVPHRLDNYGRDTEYNYRVDPDFLWFFCGINVNNPDHILFTYMLEDYENYKEDYPNIVRPDFSTPESTLNTMRSHDEAYGLDIDLEWPSDVTFDEYFAEIRNCTYYYYSDVGIKYHVEIIPERV